MYPQLTFKRVMISSFDSLYVFNLATGLYIFYLIPSTFFLIFLFRCKIRRIDLPEHLLTTYPINVFIREICSRTFFTINAVDTRSTAAEVLGSGSAREQYQCPAKKTWPTMYLGDLKHTLCLADESDQRLPIATLDG
jgi:hypothetical protein